MSKSLPEDYIPAPVPTAPGEIPRYLYDELSRLARALRAEPVALTISETSIITVTTAPNWQRLFQIDEPSWEIPGGSWDRILAAWVVPTSGLYQIICDLRVQPYGAGNKTYYAGIRLNILPAKGTPLVQIDATDSGDDNFPLGVTLPVQLPFAIGDVIYMEGTVVHDQFVGDATIDSSLQILKVSA